MVHFLIASVLFGGSRRYFNTLDSDLNGGNGDGVLSRSEFVATRQFPPFDPNIEGVEPVDFL